MIYLQRLVGPYPMWAERKIPLCTAKVDELARPKPHQLLDTFDQHLNHLSILQIENFLSKMYRKEYKTPKETIQIFTQCLMERRKRAGRQRKALRKMKFKMQRRALEATSKDAINFVRRHISTNRPSSNPTCTADNNKNVVKYSDVILLQLCKLMKQNMPTRNSCDLIGRIFINIADKLAVTMAEFIECSGLLKIDQPEINTECIKGHQKNCYPIDDCYEASSDDEVTSEDEFEDSVENLDIPSSSNQSVHEPTMSFLRPSQIIVDKEDCKNMFGQLANLKRLQAEKDAVKTAKRDARAKARAAMKKKKDGSQDCYGNVDEKPQWHVEWTEK